MAPPDERKHIAHSGATAAIGLFTGLAGDTTALNELQAISGEPHRRNPFGRFSR